MDMETECGLQSLKYLLSHPLQKKFTNPFLTLRKIVMEK